MTTTKDYPPLGLNGRPTTKADRLQIIRKAMLAELDRLDAPDTRLAHMSLAHGLSCVDDAIAELAS